MHLFGLMGEHNHEGKTTLALQQRPSHFSDGNGGTSAAGVSRGATFASSPCETASELQPPCLEVLVAHAHAFAVPRQFLSKSFPFRVRSRIAPQSPWCGPSQTRPLTQGVKNMRVYLLSTLAALTLCLGVTANASADWRYRSRIRFDYGRRIVYQERYWVPTVIVTTPAPLCITPVEPVVIDTTIPVYSTGYYYNRPYRTYFYRGPHRFYRR
jgi:hypothetical protein